MKIAVQCDICGRRLPEGEKYFSDYDSLDFCVTCYRKSRLAQLKRERDTFAAWLQATHLAKLARMDAEIDALEAEA